MWWSSKHRVCYFSQLSSLKGCFFLVLLVTLDNIVVTNVSQPFSAALFYWWRWLLYFITCPYRSMSAFLMSLFPICKRLMKTSLYILIRLWHSTLHSSKHFKLSFYQLFQCNHLKQRCNDPKIPLREIMFLYRERMRGREMIVLNVVIFLSCRNFQMS